MQLCSHKIKLCILIIEKKPQNKTCSCSFHLHKCLSQKDKVIKMWRWEWSLSLLASISCLASLSVVSPAITSAEASSVPIGWTRHHCYTPCHIQRGRDRASQAGITHHTLHVFILTHTHRFCVQYTWKQRNALRYTKKQEGMHNCTGPLCSQSACKYVRVIKQKVNVPRTVTFQKTLFFFNQHLKIGCS